MGIRVRLNVRVLMEVGRQAENAIMVLGQYREFVRDIFGKAFPIVNDFGRILGIRALFGNRKSREMDMEELGDAPDGIEFGKNVREPFQRDRVLRSEVRVPFRFRADEIFQHRFAMGIAQASFQNVSDDARKIGSLGD